MIRFPFEVNIFPTAKIQKGLWPKQQEDREIISIIINTLYIISRENDQKLGMMKEGPHKPKCPCLLQVVVVGWVMSLVWKWPEHTPLWCNYLPAYGSQGCINRKLRWLAQNWNIPPGTRAKTAIQPHLTDSSLSTTDFSITTVVHYKTFQLHLITEP